MKLTEVIELWQKGKWCISKIPELDFAAQGRTIEAAKQKLLEVVNIQFDKMQEMGTLEDVLEEVNYKKDARGKWLPPKLVATELVII